MVLLDIRGNADKYRVNWECDDMIDQIQCEVCQQVETNLYDLNLYKDLPKIGFIRFYLDHKTSIEGPFSDILLRSWVFMLTREVFFRFQPDVWNKTLASLFQVWAMWEWPPAFHQACPALCSPCWGRSPKTLARRWWFFQQNQDLITTSVHLQPQLKHSQHVYVLSASSSPFVQWSHCHFSPSFSITG